MSYEIAGRRSWLLSWFGHSGANVRARAVSSKSKSRFWRNWLNNVSSNATDADEALISQALAARHLKESLEQLPAHEQEVLLLHVSSGLTYWEIAERLGMTEEVVLRDLAHAYSQLRLELSMDELRR